MLGAAIGQHLAMRASYRQLHGQDGAQKAVCFHLQLWKFVHYEPNICFQFIFGRYLAAICFPYGNWMHFDAMHF